MTKEDYKNAFAGVGTAPDAAEILLRAEAAQPRTKHYARRAVIGLLAALLLLGALAFTANAATNGHLYEGIVLLAAGEKVDIGRFIFHYEEYVDENGAFVRRSESESPDGRNRQSYEAVQTPDGEKTIRIHWWIDEAPTFPRTRPESASEDTSAAEAAETP